jgi:hypothetical protein
LNYLEPLNHFVIKQEAFSPEDDIEPKATGRICPCNWGWSGLKKQQLRVVLKVSEERIP